MPILHPPRENVPPPLTKTTIIELANDLINETEYQQKIKDCKKLRKLKSTEKLCEAWYRGFINRFSDELTRTRTTIKDSKRNTWVTKDNFVNMYENVYNLPSPSICSWLMKRAVTQIS